jgi:hypothetical protein
MYYDLLQTGEMKMNKPLAVMESTRSTGSSCTALQEMAKDPETRDWP